ncbi:glycosyl hydrolase family 95 catalytic domain-containing protein [Niabella beijingensis]|uniref:glycoside hydrolase family 95 protein n=1 Tax=Niabella beijingensis TaxID=2872700 RepID=UPI001CBF8903|nr:glycoside hydrolase family 95 protein [Niabella beijingensis]MBZ4189158.1 glycoside hydrolase family 95 protein [Niabella beijingensis]
MTPQKYIPYLIVVLLSLTQISRAQQVPGLNLWYNQPAKIWEETLPLGNGRLGMTPDGGVTKETIVLNDITLWSGGPQDANNYEANRYLPAIMKLLKEGKNDEAQDLVNKHFICKGPGSGGAQWGCFQTLGNLQIDYDYPGSNNKDRPGNYKRTLLLDEALATTAFEMGGVSYRREYLTSFGTDVALVKLSASKPGMLNCRISLKREERGTSEVQNNTLALYGQLDNGTDGKGMQYRAEVKAALEGGTLTTGDAYLEIKQATSVTLYISAGTDFKDRDYRNTVSALLHTSMKLPFETEKKIHRQQFRKLFNRVQFDLENGANSNLPTNERLDHFYQHPEKDKNLAALFFQYGRYLAISSTRVGLLPPNLQGLWAHRIRTPWNGDYHLDVNVEMNHWPMEAANLSELNLPLADLVQGLVPNGEKTAKAYYNANGWIAHVITNVWGYTEPGESASWGSANSGSGWLCDNLWTHYAYTLDKEYLKKIYPLLKGSAVFYNDALVNYPGTKWMVTAPSVSPENAFYLPNGKTANVCMGPTIDNQIVRELFTNVIEAARILKVDADLSATLSERLALLPPPGRISKDGRIMEWMEEYKETDLQHRHISHLWGLYPGTLITKTKTPELLAPAKKTLEVRGDDGPSWTIAYKLLFWARLQDGQRSFKLLRELLKPTLRTDINYGSGGGVYPNLLSAGPPFQIDGNFGATAGIAEMLLQSHDGYIELLPSVPELWKTGNVKGLKARGNFTVSFKWKEGKVIAYKITSPVPRKIKIKVNGQVKEISAGRL